MSDDPVAGQNAEAAKFMAAERERGLRQRTDRVADAIEHMPDEDRRRVIADALIKVKSSLLVG